MLSLLKEISTSANAYAFGTSDVIQDTNKNVDTTYGEMMEEGVSLILSKLTLTEQDVFLDLGSGTGRVVLQVFLEKNIKSIGIEFIEKRYRMAEESLCQLNEKINASKVHFIKGDFFTENWSNATCVFMCNTCFTEEVMDKIMARLGSCKKLRYVILLKQLEKKPDWLDVLDSFQVPVTWVNQTNVTIYKVIPEKNVVVKRDRKSLGSKKALRKSKKK
jgi:precorrin-6B methylase 2